MQCCHTDCLCVFVNASWHCVVCRRPPRAGFGPVYCRPGRTDWCLFAKAEPQTRKLSRFCALIVVGGYVCMYFTSPPNHTPQNYNCTFFPSHEKTPRAVNQTFGSILVFKLFFSPECFLTLGFVGFLYLCNRGRKCLFLTGGCGTVGACGWLHRDSFQVFQGPRVCWERGASW